MSKPKGTAHIKNASMAERSNASDCKSDGLRPTLVQIQLGALTKHASTELACFLFVRQI